MSACFTLRGHQDAVRCTRMSADGNFVISLGMRRHNYFMDPGLGPVGTRSQLTGKRPLARTLITSIILQTPYVKIMDSRQVEKTISGIARHGKPIWTDKDFEKLLQTLAWGWIGIFEPRCRTR